MEAGSKKLFIIILISSILIILSQNPFSRGPYVYDFLDWLSYESMGGDVWVCWQDSFFGQVLPFLAYFPAIAGGLGIIGAFTSLSSEGTTKLILKIVGILAILAYVLFALLGMIFAIIGAALPLPNLPGAYFCLVPGILLIIISILIKKPDYMKGHAKENKEYFAIDSAAQQPERPTMRIPSIKCPNCGMLVLADAQFCENCGEFL
ncbi:MAG: zinc ribbon domain-containing protein [Promethearchaeota archaeon]|nr:MAG: zinc ribbon domain-containing protein [Candidatus Lokiarchaeota archaeon]